MQSSYKNFSGKELEEYINFQLKNFFPDNKSHLNEIKLNLDDALDRTLFSIKHTKLPGYTEFHYLHSDLYAQFIYFLSNVVWNRSHDVTLATKLFYLNKSLHGINCMYNTELPNIFILIHCTGIVLGKAKYADYFVACQNITVGSDKGFSPEITGPLYMGPGSSLVGASVTGEFTHMSIGSSLLHVNVLDNSLVIGRGKSLEIKQLKRNLLKEVYFNF